MEPEHFGQPVNILGIDEFFQAPVPLAAAPVILTERGQHCIAERQFCLGQVATDKIRGVG